MITNCNQEFQMEKDYKDDMFCISAIKSLHQFCMSEEEEVCGWVDSLYPPSYCNISENKLSLTSEWVSVWGRDRLSEKGNKRGAQKKKKNQWEFFLLLH